MNHFKTETKVCTHFSRGKCIYGDTCIFRHVPAVKEERLDEETVRPNALNLHELYNLSPFFFFF